ncbi:AraC family transcriptional regulator [Chitinimonas naiadis]
MNPPPASALLRQARMIELIGQLAPHEGFTLCAMEEIKLLRSNRAIPRIPVLYEPSIVVVCQGRKIGYLGDKVYPYNAQQFLVLSVPLPFECETIASPDEPMLAIAIRLNLQLAAELVMELDEGGRGLGTAPQGICSTPLDDKLGDAVLRLLEALTSPLDAQILGPGLLREIYYRALGSEQGGAIRAALVQKAQFGKIGKALRRIHAEYNGDLDVETLAHDAGMSVAAFHAHFKAVTLTSPIQYLKTTRLHKARLLMIQDGLSAATASGRVGYESPSQFSREFKRLFGRSPQAESQYLKQTLVQMPAENLARFVTAH